MEGTTKPRRVQVTKRVGGILIPTGSVYVGRPGNGLPRTGRNLMTEFGNPYKIGRDGSRGDVLAKYRAHLQANPQLTMAAAGLLAGKDLACWCPLDLPCHADILLAVANGTPIPDLPEPTPALF